MVPAVIVATVLLGAGLAGGTAANEKDPEPLFTVQDRAIQESSGLVARDGLFVTVNDSGDSPRIFTLDPEGGRTVGVTTWSGEVFDVEGLAPAADGEVWVGDIGDNLTSRSTIQVHRVPSGRGDQAAPPMTFDLDYPDGPHDAETLVAHPQSGRVYVISKEVVAGRMYAAPAELDASRPNRMKGVGEVMPLATDGAFFPDGRHLLVRGYSQAEIYTFPGLKRVAEIDLPFQPQGEGIAIDESSRVYLSSEGDRSEVVEVKLPRKVRNAVLGVTPEPPPPPAPEPEPDRPVWPYLFVGGLAGVVLFGVARLFRR